MKAQDQSRFTGAARTRVIAREAESASDARMMEFTFLSVALAVFIVTAGLVLGF